MKGVPASQDALVDIFGRIEHFFKRLKSYTEIVPSAPMLDVIVRIMVEVILILGIVTKEVSTRPAGTCVLPPPRSKIADSRAVKYLKKLIGRKDVEDALHMLDRLTQEEEKMACAEALRIAGELEKSMKGVEATVGSVGGAVESVRTKAEPIGDKLQSISDEAQGVDDKLSAAIQGESCLASRGLSYLYPDFFFTRRLDGKETRMALEGLANQIDRSFISTSLRLRKNLAILFRESITQSLSRLG